jgi:dihydrofolate reductase
MTVTLIAARSADGFLSQDGRIPWRLPDDVAQFRNYCRGQWLLVGRRTWEQMQGWFQPDHKPVVITRSAGLEVARGHSAPSVEAGLALARSAMAAECVVIGGGQIYAAALPLAHVLLLTTVETSLHHGDASFPDFPPGDWREVHSTHHPADARHPFAFTLQRLERRNPL